MKKNPYAKLIFIWMVSHEDWFWHKGKQQNEIDLYENITLSSQFVVRDESRERDEPPKMLSHWFYSYILHRCFFLQVNEMTLQTLPIEPPLPPR